MRVGISTDDGPPRVDAFCMEWAVERCLGRSVTGPDPAPWLGFTWRDPLGPPGAAALNEAMGRVLEAPQRMPMVCGACGASALHAYMNRHAPSGRGGVWVWCSGCGLHAHGSVTPPVWWRNLAAVDRSALCGLPYLLNEQREAIDAHWQTLTAWGPSTR